MSDELTSLGWLHKSVDAETAKPPPWFVDVISSDGEVYSWGCGVTEREGKFTLWWDLYSWEDDLACGAEMTTVNNARQREVRNYWDEDVFLQDLNHMKEHFAHARGSHDERYETWKLIR